MLRRISSLILVLAFSMTANAASYKVNTSGKVTSPNGKIQNNMLPGRNYLPQNSGNFYNNYSSSNYVASKQVQAGQVATIDIVMDYSGSMLNWINAAKSSMSQIIAQLPQSTKIGFRVFGQNGGSNPYVPVLGAIKSITKNKSGKYIVAATNYLGNTSGGCSATARVAPVGAYNSQNILSGMNSVSIGGSTPLTFALEQAVSQDFGGLASNYPKKIILITDGGENCGGDPCAFARELMKKRKDIHIDVVLVSSTSKTLQCLTSTTGGKFYTTNDVSSFSNILTESMKSTPVKTNAPSQNYEFIGN